MVTEYTIKHRAFVILGLVNEKMHEGGCYAYDINKTIEERGMRDWTNIGADFSFSTIYRTLERLEKDELVESYEKEIDGRTRIIYKITSFGYKILRDKVFDVIFNYIGKSDESFYTAFSMFPILTIEEQIKAFSHSLELIKNHRLELKSMLDNITKSFPRMPVNVTGLFLHPIKVLEADKLFLEMVLKQIKNLEGEIGPDDYKPK